MEDKADEVAPLEAMLHKSERALAVKTPGLARGGLTSDPVFVDRLELNVGVREGDRRYAACQQPEKVPMATLDRSVLEWHREAFSQTAHRAEAGLCVSQQ